jgi:hypothetical protein
MMLILCMNYRYATYKHPTNNIVHAGMYNNFGLQAVRLLYVYRYKTD